MSQDRVLRSGINIEPDSDAVAYWNIIMGTFMASFDLRAFPFDAQRLHVQMEIPGWAGGHVRLKPSSGGTRMFNTNPGNAHAVVDSSSKESSWLSPSVCGACRPEDSVHASF
jgi:hypothetical protein